MFGPKKTRVSKDQLKKSVVSANAKLVSANSNLKKDIASGKEKLKSIESDYDAYAKALEDTKELQIYANNELEGTQFEIAEAQTSIEEALSKVARLTEDSVFLEAGNKKLGAKNNKLFASVAELEARETELIKLTSSLKEIEDNEAEGHKRLETLAIELNELENGIEVYKSKKSAVESEFGAFKAKIEREKDIVTGELQNIKDRMAEATLACGKEMGRLDKAIAERIEEMQDMDKLLAEKDYEFTSVQAKISLVQGKVEDAEQQAEYMVDKAQEKITKIKSDFKDWKVEALDQVARLKLKGKIETIDKAGLKEVLDG